MPFTFSHPTIVLPLACLPRQWVSLTGLVIGSMTPDFEYFIRMRIVSDYSHTIGGLFWFDLPLGLILAFVFHNIVRDPLYGNLPTFFKSRLTKFKQFDWNKYFKEKWLVVIMSLLIGAASHLLWDNFTHENGYFVQLIPGLSSNMNIFRARFQLYKLLQHLSTFIGALLLIFVFWRLPEDKEDKIANRAISLNYWSLLIILTLAIISVCLLAGFDFKQYGNLITICISAVLIAMVLTPIFLKYSKQSKEYF